MVTLYDCDAKSVSELLRIVASYHGGTPQEQSLALQDLISWRPKNLTAMQTNLINATPKLTVADRLSSIAVEIDAQLKTTR
jgi:hypothetical protein